MSGMDARDHDLLSRRTELLADRILEGLDEAEMAELRTMAAAAGGDDRADAEAFILEAAAAELARAMAQPMESMPADVADRMRDVLATRQQDRAVTERVRPVTDLGGRGASTGRAGTILRAFGGFAAAAAVVLLALVIMREQFTPPVPATVADARAALVSRATDLVTLRWQATDHPDIRRARDQGLVGGEVIWSDDESEGFVRVCHLGINDPADGSYHVWIWNADAGDDAPVAACRFDVTQVNDFTVVPIDSKVAASLRGPVRASVTLVGNDAEVQRPDPADELLVARLVVPLPSPATIRGAGRG